MHAPRMGMQRPARTCMAILESNDGTLSHSFCSSFIAAGLSRSGLMDSAWPSLM